MVKPKKRYQKRYFLTEEEQSRAGTVLLWELTDWEVTVPRLTLKITHINNTLC